MIFCEGGRAGTPDPTAGVAGSAGYAMIPAPSARGGSAPGNCSLARIQNRSVAEAAKAFASGIGVSTELSAPRQRADFNPSCRASPHSVTRCFMMLGTDPKALVPNRLRE